MAVDTSLDGDNCTLWRKSDARPVAAIDDREGRVEEQIDDTAVVGILASGNAGKQFCEFRADTGKRGDGGKQRIEEGRAHAAQIAISFAHLAR
jgi:hypothetical protein